MSERTFKIIECPRDAMQSHKEFIATDKKIDYINRLLTVGFDTIDCGSFVSPKTVPQMVDTEEVLNNLNKSNSKISIVTASRTGAIKGLEHEKVDIISFPFSVSALFQKNNTNKSQEEAFELIKYINHVAEVNKKEVLIYLSMAFGNPYGEIWNEELVKEWIAKLADLGINFINVCDTIGVAKEENVSNLFKELISTYKNIEFGAHFHTAYNEWHSNVKAAYDNGCRKFDGTIKGLGGCPFTNYDKVGNVPTEKLISFANQQKEKHGLNLFDFESSWNVSLRTFGLI
ncbi:hydroxymethylglutaryl-CoA lyase [Chishuiella sp.]|uniref:hydroxymethylglutaryl-CoA lyase n=1 Tax=Chishuiella sp. TaxID=1969467 RepID=UPI0028AA6AA4|nr:hydroxymethylglutaryl-CoA lyase [Chishuiella sp.]